MAAGRRWRQLDAAEKALCAGFVLSGLALTLLAAVVVAIVAVYVFGFALNP